MAEALAVARAESFCHAARMPPPRRIQFSTGQVIGRLTVLDPDVRVQRATRTRRGVRCRCECGSERVVDPSDLKPGKVVSCGCHSAENVSKRMRKHITVQGQATHPLYQTWHKVIRRCEWPSDTSYKHYGAKGIMLCPEWHDFSTFVAYIDEHLGTRPEGYSLDRIDNAGHYEPGNVRWADRSTQRRNQQRFIDQHGSAS